MIKHTIRKDGNGNTITVRLTPQKAIIYQCRECMGFMQREVAGCTAPLCSLYPYRLGGEKTGRKPSAEAVERIKKHRYSTTKNSPKTHDKAGTHG